MPKILQLEASSKVFQKLDQFDLTDTQTSLPLLSLFTPSPQKYRVGFISSTGKMRSIAKINVQRKTEVTGGLRVRMLLPVSERLF